MIQLYCFVVQLDFRSPAGYDRTRGVEIGNKNIELTHLEEAYTSEHWLVRIYKVKDLENRQLTEPTKPVKKSRKAKKKVMLKSCLNSQNQLPFCHLMQKVHSQRILIS